MPTLDESTRIERLEPPEERVSLVLDTDAYNEVDDQFAIAHAIRSDHSVEALYAAPFHNDRSDGPGDGMAKSHEEIDRVLDRLGETRPTFEGSTGYLDSPEEPVESPVVDDLLQRARAEREEPLYVVAIGAATNVASALVADPSIADDVVVVWLGGQPHHWPTAGEFNLSQDPVAARILFDSGVPLVHVPCLTVAEALRTTVPELRDLFDGRGPVGSFLTDRVASYEHRDSGAWSKAIWDLAATAFLATPGAVESHLAHSPVLTADETWSHDPDRHLVRVVRCVDRDAVFSDVVDSLG